MQQTVWLVTVALVALVAVVFWRTVATASAPADYADISRRAASLRSRLFFLLSLVVLVVLWFTLRRLPYGAAASDAQVVEVTALQWGWQVSRDTVTAGTPVAFRVTSRDVNHGLGVYDARLRLLAQVQAMPAYENVLHVTFSEPGTYRLLCLEYCGLAHHAMMRDLVVLPTPAVASRGGR